MIVLRAINRALSWLAVLAVRSYQRFLSPLLPPACRFTPSCSHYMIEAIQRKGFVVGTLKGLWRLVRCNPFCKGGYDPVR